MTWTFYSSCTLSRINHKDDKRSYFAVFGDKRDGRCAPRFLESSENVEDRGIRLGCG